MGFSGGGGSGGGVTAVTAGDASILIGGSPSNPTVETGTLDQVANLHAPVAAVGLNAQRITNLAAAVAGSDGATLAQTLAGGDASPLTTAGDLLIMNATPVPARLAIGASNQMVGIAGGLPAWVQALDLLATTGDAGYGLVNGTGNIFTWTAPNDGNMHRVLFAAVMHVTSAQTGGAIELLTTIPDATNTSVTPFAGGLAAGTTRPANISNGFFLIEPGSTVTLEQFSAQTAGAATLWAELWGS